jgi:hypothetical protein
VTLYYEANKLFEKKLQDGRTVGLAVDPMRDVANLQQHCCLFATGVLSQDYPNTVFHYYPDHGR